MKRQPVATVVMILDTREKASLGVCALGVLLVIIGQSVSFSIVGSFGLWVAIVNVGYLVALVRLLLADTFQQYQLLMSMIHTYCLSGMTFTTTIGIDVSGIAIMSVVGAILNIIGMCYISLWLFKSTNVALLPSVSTEFVEKPIKNASSKVSMRKRDTVMTDFTNYSDPNTDTHSATYRESQFSVMSDFVDAGTEAVAKYAYEGNKNENELSFGKGDILFVEVTDKNWWNATNTAGDSGIVPANYLQVKK